MNYVVSFAAGALTSLAMTVASLKFYVSIERPYLIAALAFAVLEVGMIFMRNRRGKKASIATNTLVGTSEAGLFAIGAVVTLYGLLSIYPPNMN